MTALPLHGNNRLIRKTIIKMFPSSFAATLTTSVALMVTTLLAGAMLGQQAIAAVAIGLPTIGIFQALTQMITSGTAVKLAVYAGRSEHEKSSQAYSLGIGATAVLGLGFIMICLILAEPLTALFGGAGNPQVAREAALYLRAASVSILLGSLNMFGGKVLALYGYQKAVFRSALIAMAGNLVFSTLYVKVLPEHLAIAGLGAGAWTGGFFACLSSFVTIKIKKIPLRLNLKNLPLRELPELFRLGFSTSANNLADSVVAGVINNIIVTHLGGAAALSLYTAVKGVVTFGIAGVTGVTTAAAPLYGILYGARDKKGMLRAVKESVWVGLPVSFVWCALLVLLRPVLAQFYGLAGNEEFFHGVVLCLLFMPLCLVTRVLVQLFESTEKTLMGLLYAMVPDSLIYPLILPLLLSLWGYNGLWIAYSANAIPFLVGLYLLRSVKNKSFRSSPDRLLCLDETIRDHVPALDITIQSSNADVTGISQQVHAFLEGKEVSKRTAYMTALCLEELAADLVAHTLKEKAKNAEKTLMDIKLFYDEDALRIVIRNAASPYNPLDFEMDGETFSKVGVKLAQKVARHIDYHYVYRMNIITIDLDK